MVLGLACLVAAAGVVIARIAVARAQVSAAADLAALAGARTGDCAAARETALANGGLLQDCAIEGADILVRVRRDLVLVPGRSVGITAQARAGPA
jgi:secretion/DNA translocation related TadE-like protein